MITADIQTPEPHSIRSPRVLIITVKNDEASFTATVMRFEFDQLFPGSLPEFFDELADSFGGRLFYNMPTREKVNREDVVAGVKAALRVSLGRLGMKGKKQ